MKMAGLLDDSFPYSSRVARRSSNSASVADGMLRLPEGMPFVFPGRLVTVAVLAERERRMRVGDADRDRVTGDTERRETFLLERERRTRVGDAGRECVIGETERFAAEAPEVVP